MNAKLCNKRRFYNILPNHFFVLAMVFVHQNHHRHFPSTSGDTYSAISPCHSLFSSLHHPPMSSGAYPLYFSRYSFDFHVILLITPDIRSYNFIHQTATYHSSLACSAARGFLLNAYQLNSFKSLYQYRQDSLIDFYSQNYQNLLMF